ncbi:unnamed protein product [Periconia digitata]|uniref:Aminoglycoside phosphotransferase domain-containing protein n=1 Tax=Periconia digitata TaxID=1303443 RepID=A0A9W4UP10_9PLEO|nr:unnamed protein product [Periconia digitata]
MYDFFETQKQIWGSNERLEILGKDLNCIRAPGPTDWKLYVATEFPYYRPNPPSPLPTDEEVVDARGTENDLTKGLPCSAAVWRVRDYAVKVGRMPKILQEAENMLYLEKHCPELKIPKVWAAYKSDEGYCKNFYMLITEYIDGPSCYPPVWDPLSDTTKSNILRKLGDQVRLLRAVPPPNPTYYGRIYNQSLVKNGNSYIYLHKNNGNGEMFHGP